MPAGSAASFPGDGRLPGSGPLDDPRAGAHLRTGIQFEDTGGTRIVLTGFPPFALCVVTGDQFRRQDDQPHAACTCGWRCQRHGNRKTLSAA